MCGIVGFTGHALKEDELHKAVDTLHHRGPDGSGIHLEPEIPAGLGHARLTVIDLETGDQPLYACNRDLVLVCNGEIYEFERLRNQLIAQGHSFYTHSDSEVILHLYMKYGMEFVHSLRGEFAFLLLDKSRNRLIAVRDRFGIKPLYFNESDGKYVFASEVKAIFATGCLQAKIDPIAVRDYLCAIIPDCIFEGVKVVPPGCLMEVDLDNGQHEIRQYWDLDLRREDDRTNDKGFEHYAQKVHDALDEAVEHRLRADVPIGVYLSGGIDSSVIAASMARQHSGPLKAFTIIFPEEEKFNELRRAQAMAEKIGAEFHSITCDHSTLLHNMEDCLWVSELPFVNFHGVGKFLLSRLAQEHVKVVLTGEGADEIFLGYVFFQPGRGAISKQLENQLKKMKPHQGSHVRKIIDAIGFLPLPEHAEAFSWQGQLILRNLFHPRERKRLSESPPLNSLVRRINRNQTDDRTTTGKIQYFWIKSFLAPYILTIVGDRQEMAHAIEGRTPFLDHTLFEIVRSIPERFKIHNGVDKYVLREAYKAEVTEDVYRHEKWPFSAPPIWVKKGLYPMLDQLIDHYLCKSAIEKTGIFNYYMVQRCRLFTRLCFFDCDFKRRLNQVLIFVLTIQILDHLYIQNFTVNQGQRMK